MLYFLGLSKVAQASKVVKEPQVAKKERYLYITIHYKVSYIKYLPISTSFCFCFLIRDVIENFRLRILFIFPSKISLQTIPTNKLELELHIFLVIIFCIMFCTSRLISGFWKNISISGHFDRNGTP